ncbi:MAG: hypothetical protein WC641_03530 [Patescibacteria group bacterium]
MKILYLVCGLSLLASFGAGCSSPTAASQSPTQRYTAAQPTAPKTAPVIPTNAKNVPLPVTK